MLSVNISAQISHCEGGYNTTTGVAAYSTEDKEIPKGTREVYTNIIEQRYSVATFEWNNEHQTSRQPLGLWTTQVGHWFITYL